MNSATPASYFDALYREDDPFGYRERWYETRKRELLLATLPRPRFSSAWEIGCSNGELAAALAPRCDALLATDLSPRAVQLAAARTAGMSQVEVRQARHPEEWPTQTFDLIIFSEMGYYLDVERLSQMTLRLRASLADGGVLVACHWLTPFDEAPLNGLQVHQVLERDLGLPRLFRYSDEDIRLAGWARSDRSVGQQAGLR